MYRNGLRLTVVLIVCAGQLAYSAETEKSIRIPPKASVTQNEISKLPSIPKLPDPFKFDNGKRMTEKKQWPARRREISELLQKYVYGFKPAKPQIVTGSFADDKITVSCTQDGKSVSFTSSIQYPPAGKGPYPAVIFIGNWMTLDKQVLDELNIAVIQFPNDDLGKQGGAQDKGKGKFYDLYGSDCDAGSLIAWGWGVSRLIDVLEEMPEINIDTSKLAVTGCSRYGKGALVCGAFDERIALTIPTESGAGGTSNWRQADAMLAAGTKVQTAGQIVTENTWMSRTFERFGDCVDKLPADQHMAAVMCAPRGLLIADNTEHVWLGGKACYTTAMAAHTVWQALGVPDKMGFVQKGHDHCKFEEKEELKAFLTKFLLDGNADTDIFTTTGNFDKDLSEWIDWDVPVLK